MEKTADTKDMVINHIEASEEKSNVGQVQATMDKQGFLQEREMTLWQGLKTYPWAVGWSVLMSIVIVMEGYDIVLIGGLIAQPAFVRRYGSYYDDLGWQISGPWQVGLGNATTCGTLIGALANGYLTDKFGYRRTMLGSLLMIIATIFITFFATSTGMLVAGSLLSGIPWGVFSVLAPAYSSEICPTVLRGYLANFVCLCWAIGMLISSGVQQAFEPRDDQWAYRIPFAIQWVWPVPLLCVLWFAPESPWMLIRKGNLEDGKKVIKRLSPNQSPDSIEATVSFMQHTIDTERELDHGTSYWDCFKGTNLRRTEICCMAYAAQQLGGNAIMGNPVYFFTQAGLGSSDAYKLSVGSLGMSSLGVIISWFLIYHYGRRSLYVFSLAFTFLCLLAVGTAAAVSDAKASSFSQAGIVLVSNLVSFSTVGPVCYAILSEMSSVRLRSKTISISRTLYYIMGIIVNTAQPYLINPTEANLKGVSAFVWAGTCFLILAWSYFRLPETKDRLFEEIDILFAKKVDARKFKDTKVDVFDRHVETPDGNTSPDA